MRWTIASALLFAACASAAPEPIQLPGQPPARVDPNGGGYDIMLDRADQPIGLRLAAPADRVWPLALAAYSALGLRVDGSDAAHYLAQTRGQLLRRQLNGIALSTYFDCGTELSGSIADSWRLKLDARMAVAAGTSPDSSALQTLLTVTATPVEGTSAQVTPCSSRGRLETKLAQLVRDALARQPAQ